MIIPFTISSFTYSVRALCSEQSSIICLNITRSISMVSKPFVFEVFVVKSAQAVTLSIIVLMCVTINDRTALKVTDVVRLCFFPDNRILNFFVSARPG